MLSRQAVRGPINPTTFLFSSMVSLQLGLQELGGFGAFALGILAVSDIHPTTLILAGLLELALVGLASGVGTGLKILRGRHVHAE